MLQAYLPDTLGALEYLAEFAQRRVAEGGSKIKIRLVKGANLSMERHRAEVKGWPQAPYLTKDEVDANYYRLLDFILRPEYADALSVGIASHNLFTSALAYELAQRRSVTSMVDSQMLQGMSPAQQEIVRDAYGRQILYTPVVKRDDFDVAVSYLVRRLEETAAPQNFLPALFAPRTADRDPIKEQEEVFRRAVDNRWDVHNGPNRTQDRTDEQGRHVAADSAATGRFLNEPDTDPALAANRAWAIEHLHNPPAVDTGEEITDPRAIRDRITRALEAQQAWGARSANERAEVLEAIGNEIAGEFEPNKLTVVVPPWNLPVAIPTGGVMASLAAGSAVILKPAPQVTQCAKLIADCIHTVFEAKGIDQDTVQYVRADEGEAGKALLTDDAVDAIILTGASDTAQLFKSWNPKLNVVAETSGKNAIIITPSADPDLAVNDLYLSAFGHSGQKCSAASLAILVGSAGDSHRLRNQLLDAASTLVVGPGTDLSTTMNGLIEAPGEKLERGLTRLEPGETWLLEPKRLDEEGKFWSPGIRDNVKPGSWYHQNECFGPVLGIMHAKDLDEAIEWQNSTGYGLTAGIHTLDGDEINHWLDRVEAGNVYVNRGITGAIVQRRPFGGWKKSSVGPGAKAGGPNYVAQMGTWRDSDALAPSPGVSISAKVQGLLEEFRPHVSMEDYGWLSRAAEYDQRAWDREFGHGHDYSGLRSEANIFRYRTTLEPVVIYVGEHYALRDVYLQLLAAAVTGTEVRVVAPAAIAAGLEAAGITVDAHTVEGAPPRVRVIGDAPGELYGDVSTAVFDGPALIDGRRELLPYLLEQSVSATLHRFGVIHDPAGIRG